MDIFMKMSLHRTDMTVSSQTLLPSIARNRRFYGMKYDVKHDASAILPVFISGAGEEEPK